ncbi:MAG: RluA family pseudouridine synthase [Clostridiales bacterium]|nr:RluA family pseudouridine synthase [Clostridiales bacterium]
MDRTIRYQIQKEDAGIRVDQFLRRRFYSRQNLAQLKKEDGTWRNGQACPLIQKLSCGDILEVHIREDSCSENIPGASCPAFVFMRDAGRAIAPCAISNARLSRAIPISIVYEDEDILVVNKPAGLPMHPSRDNFYYSLVNAVMYYYRNSGSFVFRCTNRLDRDTSGLTVIAKHPVSASVLGSMVKSKGNGSQPVMEREYLAIACGAVTPAGGTICAPLARKANALTSDVLNSAASPERSIERCVDFEHGERAVTHYRVLEAKNGYSLLSILLETGRTHQIRVHMAYLGYPLAGDYLYHPACRAAAIRTYSAAQLLVQESPKNAITTQVSTQIPSVTVPMEITGISRQALHAYRLTFPHPITGEILEFTAPLPEDMQKFNFRRFLSTPHQSAECFPLW